MTNGSEPTTLINFGFEDPTPTAQNMNRFSSFKIYLKKFGYYVLMMMIPLLVITITTIQIKKELKQLKTDFNEKINETKLGLNQVMILKNGSYEDFFNSKSTIYMAQTKEKMNFTSGQSACKMVGGHMIELHEIPNDLLYYTKRIATQFCDKFYTGLRKEGNIWKWVSTGQILGHRKGLWNKGEPINKEGENCARVEKDLKTYELNWEVNYGLNDVDCSMKSNIICIKNSNE